MGEPLNWRAVGLVLAMWAVMVLGFVAVAHGAPPCEKAYAITVHKSQGSEYPAVVAPLHMQHRMLLQRNLLYTAVTRARRFAVLVGEHRAMQMAVRNDEPMTRATLLRWYLNPNGQRQARERVGDRAES